MNASNRSTLITKSHTVLKKHYKPVVPPTDRSVIEHLLYAGVLEDPSCISISIGTKFA
jgi:hypothetical protein